MKAESKACRILNQRVFTRDTLRHVTTPPFGSPCLDEISNSFALLCVYLIGCPLSGFLLSASASRKVYFMASRRHNKDHYKQGIHMVRGSDHHALAINLLPRKRGMELSIWPNLTNGQVPPMIGPHQS
ncbi:hypothetical protein ACTXT7_012870 [Hymenolepis weldensis]